jgi:hypothetical protein
LKNGYQNPFIGCGGKNLAQRLADLEISPTAMSEIVSTGSANAELLVA